MNFLRTNIQGAINRFRAIKRRFHRPRQISESESETETETEGEYEVPEPFPLRELPQLALRKIVIHLDPVTLIDLSMTSDEFNEKMKGIKLSAKNFSWSLFDNQTHISCRFEDSTFILACIHENPKGPVVERIVGGEMRLVNLYRQYGSIGYKFKISRRDRQEEEVKITTQLLSIVKPEAYSLYLNGRRSLMDLFVWKFSANFSHIDLESNYATYLFGPPEAQFIFQEVVVKDLEIKFKRRPEGWRRKRRTRLLDTTRTIQLRNTIQKITVYNLDLFSAENIINSQIKHLEFSSFSGGSYGYRNRKTFKFYRQLNKLVFYNELNKIMKAWQEGEKLTQLERIKIPCEGISDEEWDGLFDGLDWTSERPIHPEFESFIGSYGLVGDSLIRRRTDDQLASFSADCHDTLHFVVWKESTEIWPRNLSSKPFWQLCLSD